MRPRRIQEKNLDRKSMNSKDSEQRPDDAEEMKVDLGIGSVVDPWRRWRCYPSCSQVASRTGLVMV